MFRLHRGSSKGREKPEPQLAKERMIVRQSSNRNQNNDPSCPIVGEPKPGGKKDSRPLGEVGSGSGEGDKLILPGVWKGKKEVIKISEGRGRELKKKKIGRGNAGRLERERKGATKIVKGRDEPEMGISPMLSVAMPKSSL